MSIATTTIASYEILQVHDYRLANPDLPGIEALRCAVAVETGSRQWLLEFQTSKVGPAFPECGAGGAEEFFGHGYGRAAGYLEMTIQLHNELVAALADAGAPGQMDPAELDFILTRTHHTAGSAAKFLGVAITSVDKWLAGQRAISGPVGRIMRVIATSDDAKFSHELPEVLAEAGGEIIRVEFSLTLDMLAWSHAEAALALGLSTRTFKNWAAGDRRVFQPAARLLRVMVSQGAPYTSALSRLLIEAAQPISYPPALILAA